MVTVVKAAPNGAINGTLEGLALEAENLETVATVDAAAVEVNPDEAKSMAVIEAGFQSVLLGLLKMGRAWIAARLPEIQDEWKDETLEAPAAAAMPLVKKHLAGLMDLVGSSPELAALVFACLPLGLGVVTAMEKADQRRRLEAAPPPQPVTLAGVN
jgi:hypothetical protein